MGPYSRRRQATYALLLFIMLLLLVPRAGHDGDVAFWVNWASYISEHGLGNVYRIPDNNYNPLYHYFLWFYGQLLGNTDKLQHYRHWLKTLTLIFDFAGAFWAASLVPDRERRFGLALLLLLNISYLYNTLLWEQVDAIYTCFAFGAVIMAVKQRPVISFSFFVLSLLAKTQAIIFLPPLLLLWIPEWRRRPKHLLLSILAAGSLATLLLAPFIWWSWENYLPRIIEINLKAAEVYPRLSMGAYNLWYMLVLDPSPNTIDDSLPFAKLTYRAWGLLLFFVSSGLALLPLLAVGIRNLRTRSSLIAGPDVALVMLSCGLVPLLFTFFNTQMHERYWHASMLFMAAYGFLRRDYFPYVIVSIAYFLNLENVLRYLGLLNYSVLVFMPWFVASLFALAIGLGFVKLYRLVSWRGI